jgi:hypothetical protein
MDGKRTGGGTSMASGISQDRLQAAREVVTLLRTDRSFRDSIVVNPCGERPILVATVDDPMEDVLRRVESTGLPVTLCVRAGSASITVATLRPVEPDDHPGDSTPIDPRASVGMFISLVWMNRTVAFHLETCNARAAEYELEFA